MGGFGFMSYHRGTQMDHLIELEVVTGEGERRVCSPSSDRQLFDAVRATHGQLAIITRARIPLERAPRKVRMLQAAYGSVESLLSDMERLAREKGAGGGEVATQPVRPRHCGCRNGLEIGIAFGSRVLERLPTVLERARHVAKL